MVLFAKVVLSTLALLPFFVFIEKRLGQHWERVCIMPFAMKIDTQLMILKSYLAL